MTCDDVRLLFQSYTDGELDLVRHLDVESHLQDCASCGRACEKLRALQVILRSPSFRFEAPPRLRDRIEASLRDQSPARRGRRWLWPSLAVAAVLLVLAAGGLVRFLFVRAGEDRLAQDVVASHVRSLLAEHITDIRSGDGHEVKPWFQRKGKLDFSFPVHDLSEQGFPLYGGRLDYLGGHRVAALVYQRRKHFINLLIWPATAGDKETEPRSQTRQGYHLVDWRRQGMNWWAVSDLDPRELAEFAQLLRQRD